MNTYFVKTEGPKGSRGGKGIRYKAIVIAASESAAREIALTQANTAGTVVTACELVDGYLRVSVS